MLSVIIPANNEAPIIGRCLGAVLASAEPGVPVHVIVVANGCTDDTAARAEAHRIAVEARGWRLTVIDLPEGSKIAALNAGDAAAGAAAEGPGIRAYLDADVTLSPDLLAQTVRALGGTEAAYAAGALRITAKGPVSRAYARFWSGVPFMAQTVPGCGYFAMNAAGRARWGDWPAIIADDLFARLNFAPSERHGLAAGYDWPIAEGAAALVRVRRRQDAGVAEIERRYPALLRNEDKISPAPGWVAGLALKSPLGFLTYAAVAVAVRLGRQGNEWSRSR